MTKKYIEEFKTLYLWELIGTLQDLQNKIVDLLDEGWIYIDLYDDRFELSKQRLETNNEYEQCIKYEKKNQEIYVKWIKKAKEKE